MSIQLALQAPQTDAEAKRWVAVIARLVGKEFHPDRAFGSYAGSPLKRLPLAELDQALAAAKAILGERIYDIAYRESTEYLFEMDPDWSPVTGPLPATQPPARWWRVDALPELPRRVEPPVYLAYEDQRGMWWSYDPLSQKLYESHWLRFQCYRDELLHRRPFRMTKISPDQARELIAEGLEPFNGWPRHLEPGPDVHEALGPSGVTPDTSEPGV